MAALTARKSPGGFAVAHNRPSMPDTGADVIVAGAGPTGLMLAAELRLAGVRPLVLERRPELRDTPKAGGIGGQILQLLRLRGVLERLEAASPDPTHPAPIFPFGNIHLDFTRLPEPPMWGLRLPQPQLERLLDERARELGAVVRRGHEVTGARDGDAGVAVDVRGPDGPYVATGRWLVGCDGPRSTVREIAGIPFPGTTYPEVNRLGQVTLPGSVRLLDDGALDVPGLGRVAAGFTETDGGTFAFGPLGDGALLVYTTEDTDAEIDADEPMGVDELRASIRRVLGGDLPVASATRLSRWQFQARQASRYRDGRLFVAGDAAHQFPATGIGLSVGMLDAVNLAWKLGASVHGWAPDGLLDTYHSERVYAGGRGMLHTQAQVALRRGRDAAADALRELFLELMSDEPPLLRMGRLLAGTDVRYAMPGAGAHPLAGTFSLKAGAMPDARPVFVDLADRADLRDVAAEWEPRVEIRVAATGRRPADALLIRPDAHVAWAAPVGAPDATGLREALACWFGAPVNAADLRPT